MEPILSIGSRTYRKEDYVFKVSVDELEDLRIGDLPAHSSVEVVGLPEPPDDHEFYLTVTNGGDGGDHRYLDVFGCIIFGQTDALRRMGRLRRAYLPFVERGDLPDAVITPPRSPNRFSDGPAFSLSFAGRPATVVREAISPLILLFEKLSLPEVRLFICHASEDKEVARDLASHLLDVGADVWFDQWEIRVGDSIVEKINGALTKASHLVLLLSAHSVTKPWVKREFSSALMRQLADSSISVLPVRLDDCEVPAILSDIKYADCRKSIADGLNETLNALFPERFIRESG